MYRCPYCQQGFESRGGFRAHLQDRVLCRHKANRALRALSLPPVRARSTEPRVLPTAAVAAIAILIHLAAIGAAAVMLWS